MYGKQKNSSKEVKMSKSNVRWWISLLLIVLIGGFVGCSDKKTTEPGPESGSPLVNKSGEAWVPVEGYGNVAIFVFKASGVLETYRNSVLFGMTKRGEFIFRTEGNKLFVISDGYEEEHTYTITDNGQTLILTFESILDFVWVYTKQRVNTSNAKVYPDLYGKDFRIYIGDLRIDVYSRQYMTDIELTINGTSISMHLYGEWAFGSYNFEDDMTYQISMTATTANRTYTESASITTVQRANMNVQKSDADNWWDFPVQITWSFPNNNKNSMLQEASFEVEGYDFYIFESGLIEPGLRSFTIPAGFVSGEVDYSDFYLLQINYVLTNNASFISDSYSGAWWDSLAERPQRQRKSNSFFRTDLR